MRRTLGILFVLGPFVAGAVAALSARRDFRLIGMAAVATFVVWLLPPKPSAAVALTAGTGSAAVVAFLAGARSPIGIALVALVLSAFAVLGRRLTDPRGTPETLHDPAV